MEINWNCILKLYISNTTACDTVDAVAESVASAGAMEDANAAVIGTGASHDESLTCFGGDDHA